MKDYVFTSESVSEGHPDKICDQISDAVLDACLSEDPESRVACEAYTTTGMVLVGGEITTETYVSIQDIAREVVRDIGYNHPDYGIDWESMAVMSTIHSQSEDIAIGVTQGSGLFAEQGAGDQGMMFGYACRETEELMPAPIIFAHKILKYAAEVRKSGKLDWLRPDSKSQVTIAYRDGKPAYVDTVVVSHQHNPEINHDKIQEALIEEIVKPVLAPTGLLTGDTRYFINPTGRFVIGGPHGDTGLTGRKIIVDTYGGMGRHGGGAFSGKDPSKVDRSAAYVARYVAKNVVAAGFCDRCEIELAYAIGVPFPVSVTVDSHDTGKIPDSQIEKAIEKVFDLTPSGIIKTLDLKKPIYRKTASYGHFGRDSFPWEKTDKIEDLKKEVK
ncbi:MAG: methionine adenosyltransferase [Spirochaetia bacterium]